MNTHSKSLLFLTGAAVLVSAPFVSASGFVRPGVWYSHYTMDGGSGEVGGSVAAGWNLGTDRAHELSFELAYVGWSYEKGTAPLKATGDGHLTPMLLNYRYSFGEATSGVRFYVGGAAGAAKISGHVERDGSGVRYRGDVSATEFAFGPTVGLSGVFAETFSYEIGYRYLVVGDSSVGTQLWGGASGWVPGGPTVKSPKFDAHVITAALVIRF